MRASQSLVPGLQCWQNSEVGGRFSSPESLPLLKALGLWAGSPSPYTQVPLPRLVKLHIRPSLSAPRAWFPFLRLYASAKPSGTSCPKCQSLHLQKNHDHQVGKMSGPGRPVFLWAGRSSGTDRNQRLWVGLVDDGSCGVFRLPGRGCPRTVLMGHQGLHAPLPAGSSCSEVS